MFSPINHLSNIRYLPIEKNIVALHPNAPHRPTLSFANPFEE